MLRQRYKGVTGDGNGKRKRSGFRFFSFYVCAFSFAASLRIIRGEEMHGSIPEYWRLGGLNDQTIPDAMIAFIRQRQGMVYGIGAMEAVVMIPAV